MRDQRGTDITVGRVIVVGGGIGGVSLVAALRSGGYDGELVLIERSELPYDRPPLSKDYLSGARDLKQIALQAPEWYVEQHVTLLAPATVVALRPDAGEVELADGRVLVADRIVLATGGRAARPPIPGSDSGRVHVLRDADDADRLRDALVPGARLLVVGGGLIGAETASTARDLGAQVVLVDPLDPPLAAAVGPELARWMHEQHAAHGVETVTTTVEAFEETPTGIAAQLRGEPGSREFDAVLFGVGMVPVTELAAAAGIEVDGGVLVDERQATSHAAVLAIGDVARLRDHHRTEHWEAAIADAQRAAAAILGADPPADAASWFWSDRYHRHVEVVGTMRQADAAHTVVVRGEIGPDPFSVFVVKDALVVGALSVDDANAVRAARRLIDRAVSVDVARLADVDVDLRKLLR